MRMLPIILSIVLVLALTSCSTIGEYVSGESAKDLNTTNNTKPEIVNVDKPFDEDNDSDDAEKENTTDTETETDGKEDTTEENMEKDKTETEEESGDVKEPQGALTNLELTEGDTVDLSKIKAKDPDGDEIEYEYSEPVNDEGIWKTEEGDAGNYTVKITATDGMLETTEEVSIEVKAMNKPPVIDCPSSFTAKEGERIDLPCTFYDPDEDKVSYEVSGYMDSLTAEADYDEAGEYTVNISASDGKRSTSSEIDLTIEETNRPPRVQSLATITVNEQETVDLNIQASDPDEDEISIEYPSQFSEDGTWKTTSEDIGTYNLKAVVTDGENEVTVPVNVVVEDVDRMPTIEPIEDITVKEGETVTLPVNMSDPDSEDLEIEVISDLMNSTEYTIDYNDAGEHDVKVSVSDGNSTVSETLTVTVENSNRPPVFVGN